MPLSQPNVVVICTDDQEVDSIDTQTMPYLESQPHGNWVTFSRAILSTPLCHPHRANFITGQRSDVHGRNINTPNPPPFDEAHTLAPWLSGAGYRTGHLGKYLNAYPWELTPYVPPGWDTWFGTGTSTDFTNWTAYDDNALAVAENSTYLTDELAARAVAFIEDADPRPFFLYVAPISGHDPFTPASRHASVPITLSDPANFNDVTAKPAWLAGRAALSTADQTTARNNRVNARRSLRSTDEMIEDVFAALATKGVLENTVVVFLTDNGQTHGRVRIVQGKGMPYRFCVDSLLRIRYPGAAARNIASPVSAPLDVVASITTWAGANPTKQLDGYDLTNLIENNVAPRTQVEAWYPGQPGSVAPGWWALYDSTGVYVEWTYTGERERYDWTADPDEMSNIYNASTHAGLSRTLAQLRARSQPRQDAFLAYQRRAITRSAPAAPVAAVLGL